MAGNPSSPEQVAQGRHINKRIIRAASIPNFFIGVLLLFSLEIVWSWLQEISHSQEKCIRSGRNNQPFDYPRSKARGLLRVDTERRFYPVLKAGVWRRRSINNKGSSDDLKTKRRKRYSSSRYQVGCTLPSRCTGRQLARFEIYKFSVALKAGLYRSLRFDGIIGFEPLVPATLQGIDFLKTSRNKLPCRPGTGLLIGSAAVKDKCFVLGIFVRPAIDILLGILTYSTLNFPFTFFPFLLHTDIHNDHIGIP